MAQCGDIGGALTKQDDIRGSRVQGEVYSSAYGPAVDVNAWREYRQPKSATPWKPIASVWLMAVNAQAVALTGVPIHLCARS